MFCYQCEQTSKGTGCTDFAVCGKTESTAILQDLLVHAAKGIAQFSHRARRFGAADAELDRFLLEALFVTVTNVNFDDAAIEKTIRRAIELRERAKTLYQNAAAKSGKAVEDVRGPATWSPAGTTTALVAQGEAVLGLTRRDRFGADVAGLQELLLYGVKGMAAYAEHALVLGHENDSVHAFIGEVLFYLAEEIPSVEKLLALNLKCGEVNLLVMELLDTANTSAYGHPVPTPVRVEPLRGKAILVSGHDLKDLEKLDPLNCGLYAHDLPPVRQPTDLFWPLLLVMVADRAELLGRTLPFEGSSITLVVALGATLATVL